jgi:hypothetical protein
MSYSDLINVDDFEKKEYFSQERWEISFYCKDCKKLVETDRPDPNGYQFICKTCEWENIVIWTQEWLKSNYRLK